MKRTVVTALAAFMMLVTACDSTNPNTATPSQTATSVAVTPPTGTIATGDVALTKQSAPIDTALAALQLPPPLTTCSGD